MAEPDGAVERPSGWLRLTLTTLATGALPVWLVLTATLAQLSPQSVVVQVDGELQVVEVLDYWGAAWTASSWLLLVGLVVAPWAWVVGRMSRRRAEADPRPQPVEDVVLPADTPWEVTRRSFREPEAGEPAERPADAEPSAVPEVVAAVDVPPPAAPTTNADLRDPAASSSDVEQDGRSDDVDALFR